MAKTWQRGTAKGIFFREHKTRKHGIKKDRYYALIYKRHGKTITEAVGWQSDGITENFCAGLLADLRKNWLTGEGFQSLAEKRQAEEAARAQAIKKQKAEEQAAAEADAKNKTFKDVWLQYFELAKATKTKETARTERYAIELWALPAIGKKRMNQILTLDLERIKKNILDAGRAPRTAQHVLAMIRHIINFAIEHDLYQGNNPAKKVKKLKFDNKRMRFLSREEAEFLLAILKNKHTGLHDMSLLSLHTGLRAGELFSLTWNDVDFDNERLSIKDTKGKQNRFVYLSHAALDMLKKRFENSSDDLIYVFPGKDGRKMKELSRTFDKILAATEINKGVTDRRHKVSFHTFRHTSASWLVQAGTPLYTVQQILGHKDATMTARYSHLAPGNLQAATKIFDSPKKTDDVLKMKRKKK
jgi:integrase